MALMKPKSPSVVNFLHLSKQSNGTSLASIIADSINLDSYSPRKYSKHGFLSPQSTPRIRYQSPTGQIALHDLVRISSAGANKERNNKFRIPKRSPSRINSYITSKRVRRDTEKIETIRYFSNQFSRSSRCKDAAFTVKSILKKNDIKLMEKKKEVKKVTLPKQESAQKPLQESAQKPLVQIPNQASNFVTYLHKLAALKREKEARHPSEIRKQLYCIREVRNHSMLPFLIDCKNARMHYRDLALKRESVNLQVKCEDGKLTKAEFRERLEGRRKTVATSTKEKCIKSGRNSPNDDWSSLSPW